MSLSNATTVIKTTGDKMWWTSILQLLTAVLGLLVAVVFFCMICMVKRWGFFSSFKSVATKGIKVRKNGNSHESSSATPTPDSSENGIPCDGPADQLPADGGFGGSHARCASVPVYRSEGDPTQRSQCGSLDRQPSPEKPTRTAQGIEDTEGSF